MNEAEIKKALTKAKPYSEGRVLSRCLMFKNAIGFLFEDPNEPIYGGDGYIMVYTDGSVGVLPTIPENYDILSKGVLVNIPAA